MTATILTDQSEPQYVLIEAAMAYLANMRTEQPSLEELAAHIGYAPAHLQKVFTRWVGVSPKRFLSYLTLEYAKQRLAEADSVLDAALAAGLSGPSRLHDLLVAHEAITPGDFKRRGEGVTMRWAWRPCAFGDALVPYQWVAKAIGQPKAARAVGAAIGRNPISLLIPCHRAILSSGYLRNYEWGLPRKMAMIGWEAARRAEAA